MISPLAPQRLQSQQRGAVGVWKEQQQITPTLLLEPWPLMGDERRASTLLENGAIFCIRAVFQASCRLQDVNCFIGCDLTAFLGFLGDSQAKKLFFAKEGRAESLWSYDSRIWGSSSDHSSLYLDDEYFCPSTGGSTHTWEADRNAALAGAGTDQSVITGACGKVRHFIFLPRGGTGYFYMWHLFWTLLHMRTTPVLEPLLKSAGATEKNFPRTRTKSPLCSPHFMSQGYLWEPEDWASSILENLKTFWQLKDGHKWVTLNSPGT